MSRAKIGKAKRPSDAAIKTVIRRAGDNCSLCGKPLRHGEVTSTGYVKRRLHFVAECCRERLDDGLIYGVGIFLAPDLGEPTHMRADREWFAAHPDRSHRVRVVIPGETYDSLTLSPDSSHVVVRQLRPGARQRIGFVLPEMPPDNEIVLHAIFDLACEAMAGGKTGFMADAISERAIALSRGGHA